MNHKSQSEKTIREIIDRVMSSPIPENGQLVHPIPIKKRVSKPGQQSLVDVIDKTNINVANWGSKDFVDYFANKFQDVTGGNYRKTYRADSPAFQEMINFFSTNGVNKTEWTKKFIDWCFVRRELIKRKFGYFVPHTMLNVLNYYYQDEILPLVENETIKRDSENISLVDELSVAFSNGQDFDAFGQFGIPITATYMINIKGTNRERLIEAIKKRLLILLQNNRAEVKKILLKSIINSPYLSSYELLDWRDLYSDITKSFESESWWRDSDYRGQPLDKYKELIT